MFQKNQMFKNDFIMRLSCLLKQGKDQDYKAY